MNPTACWCCSDNGADPNLLPEQPAFRPWYEAHYPYTYEKDYGGNYAPMGQKGSYSDYGAGWAAAANTPTSYYKTFSSEGGLRVPFIATFRARSRPAKRRRALPS